MFTKARLVCCVAGFFLSVTVGPAAAQEEVYHPGETYDSLQAGQDAYLDAEAQRRALIGRQIMIEEQIVQQNTWADPQDKYRPVRPESYGPIRPKTYGGPTLADTYAYPDGGPVYYGGSSWPRVPNDIWGMPYYGYVRQPIGHVKIWTGRLSYIYKPIYASPPMENHSAYAAAGTGQRQPLPEPRQRNSDVPSPTSLLNVLPPPPKPMVPQQSNRPDSNLRKPSPNRVGQEI